MDQERAARSLSQIPPCRSNAGAAAQTERPFMSTEKAAFTRPAARLTHAGALIALNAAVAKAEAMGVPQNISIVDEGGNLLAFVRMDGAKLI